MANELVIHHPTGATLYALLFDATGQIYNGSTFGAPSSASWTDYDIAMSEAATATGIYRADMPAVAAGAYGWVVRKQAGGSPAVGDIAVGAGSIRWTGTAEETVPAAVNVTYSAGVAVSGRLAEAADLPAAAPTADVVADAVWDEMIADHAVAGSTGEALDGATAPTAAAIWSYVSRTLTATPAQTTDGTTASAITRKRGNSWSISLTLGALTGYTSLWFTVKRSYDDADSAALVQIKLNASGLSDGLLTVNGAAATNDALGSITVSDATTGAIVIALDETVTDDIAPGVYYYDAQALISGDVSTPDSGTLTVTADVTRSVT